jgi:hypothetical protein
MKPSTITVPKTKYRFHFISNTLLKKMEIRHLLSMENKDIMLLVRKIRKPSTQGKKLNLILSTLAVYMVAKYKIAHLE